MCGISGFIGSSKNIDISFNILTNLFNNLQQRGVDASGYYACSDNNIYYYKQKGCSKEIIDSPQWKDFKNLDFNAFILHTRRTSFNSGSSDNNENNHPFVTEDKLTALIHNGIIDKNDYNKLKSFLETKTECDSEILLRFLCRKIFDDKNYFSSRINSINELLFFIKNSEYAFAFVDLINNIPNLWLVKNDKRPLFLIDLTKSLNQYFFVSTIEIWQDSISNIKNINKTIGNYNIIKLPNFSIINISYNNLEFNKSGFYFNNYDFKEKYFSY